LIIDSKLHGPYTSIRNENNFSDDSSYFIYHYKQGNSDEWVENKIALMK
jgi:hypothetical protein